MHPISATRQTKAHQANRSLCSVFVGNLQNQSTRLSSRLLPPPPKMSTQPMFPSSFSFSFFHPFQNPTIKCSLGSFLPRLMQVVHVCKRVTKHACHPFGFTFHSEVLRPYVEMLYADIELNTPALEPPSHCNRSRTRCWRTIR